MRNGQGFFLFGKRQNRGGKLVAFPRREWSGGRGRYALPEAGDPALAGY